MTSLITGLNTTLRGWFAAANGRLYFANGFDAVRVLTADTGYSAGITGPTGALGAVTSTAVGLTTLGNHLVRYRYKDSRTGYVSNPSDALTVNVAAGAQTLNWTINVAGPIVPSTDTKVDTILIEMTPVNAGNYFQATSVLNSAVTVAVSIADATLGQQINSDSEYGSATKFDLFSHEPPPALSVMAVQRGRGFVGVDSVYSVTVLPTNGSPTINGSGFSVKWAGRMFQQTGDTAQYEILSATTTVITLTTNYVGAPVSTTGTIFSKLPNRIYYSRPGYVEEYFPSTWARDVLGGKGDRLVAMWPRRDALYLFGKYSGERLAFITDPGAATSSLLAIEGNRGVFNQRCIAEADGVMYAMDRQGIYQVAEVPKQISLPIDEALREMVDYSQDAQCHCGFEPNDRLLVCWFVRSGDSYPMWAAVYEIDTGRWWLHQSLVGITASAVIPSTDGQVRLWQGDSNGYLWATGIEGSYDGVPPTCPSVVTVTAGSTTTSVNVSETLETTIGLAGATITTSDQSNTSIISSNSANNIAVSPALTTAPAAGATMYLGAIPWSYTTKWFVGGGMAVKKRPQYLQINVVPDSGSGTMRVYFYTDFDATNPVALTALPTDTPPRGVSIINGNTYATIDLSILQSAGYIAVPLPNDWKRVISAKVTSLIPSSDIRILDIQFTADETPVPNE